MSPLLDTGLPYEDHIRTFFTIFNAALTIMIRNRHDWLLARVVNKSLISW
jgi:hypothetical protein